MLNVITGMENEFTMTAGRYIFVSGIKMEFQEVGLQIHSDRALLSLLLEYMG